jgi:murein DD-endopeptidase MepM/ murein hydrolase activator NlpD
VNELLLFGGGGIAAYLLLRHSNVFAAAAPVSPPSPNASPTASAPLQIAKPVSPVIDEMPAPRPATVQLAGRWLWPVLRWQGRAPVISDGFGSPRGGGKHQGVDVMFTRIATDPYPAGTANGTKQFVMPEAWVAIAASDGVLWSADKSPRGWQVVVDHGSVATYYQHLSALFVPTATAPAKGTPRDKLIPIKAGQPIGVVGADPMEQGRGVKHLHFEVWVGGPSNAVDPAPVMKSWEVISPPNTGGPLVARNLRNISAREQSMIEKRKKYGDRVPVEGHFRAWPGTANH